MTPYMWRLCCLSLAASFAVQVCAGLLIRRFAVELIKWAARFEPARAAGLVLILRWLPGLLGLFVAGALCVPSYLRLEPIESNEEIGFVCLALAALAVLSYLIPLARIGAGVVRSELRLKSLLSDAEVQANVSDVLVIHHASPAMALVGLFRSRVLISRDVMRLLTQDQMDAALRHERAHFTAHDNYKRLVLGFAPIDGSGRKLQAAWSRFTEWAADDHATEGDSARSVALASALVSVARLTSPGCVPSHASVLESPLISGGPDLRARVERLLESGRAPAHRFPVLASLAWALTVALAVATIAQHPAASAFVHRLLEALID
jgi:hypothetical protein